MNNKNFKKQLIIPAGISINLVDDFYFIRGPRGEIKHQLNSYLSIDIFSDYLLIYLKDKGIRKRDIRKLASLVNTTYSLFKSYFIGVMNYFKVSLFLKGIGYKANFDKSKSVLNLSLGYSHSIKMCVPSDIFVEVVDLVNIVVSGVSKISVGQFAWNIKNKRLPEVYKGNGIIYRNEVIKIKSPKKNK